MRPFVHHTVGGTNNMLSNPMQIQSQMGSSIPFDNNNTNLNNGSTPSSFMNTPNLILCKIIIWVAL
ncbi:DASH complex subunit DUO1 [Bienertia sinuspersici]